MQKQRTWRYSKFVLLIVAIAVGGTGTAFATTSTSNTYQVSETQFGGGSSLESCSGQYCAKTSIGNIGGNTGGSSSSGSATFGDLTADEPRLEMIVDPGTSNLGVLTAEHTATKTTSVQIRNYLGDGYTLQIVGDPPKFAGHTLSTPSSPTASTPGVEQFAINVTNNSTPNIGTAPVQVPTGVTDFGVVDTNYDNANQFMYSSEAVIARSAAKSGRTDYTISFIINISNATPAGHYEGEYSAVLVPAF
jgi:hypothetical protein